MFKVNQKVKKYKYLTSSFLNERFSYTSHRFLTASKDPRKSSPLNIEELPYPVKWEDYFKYQRLVVELGCGHGELLAHLGENNQDTLHVGFEITKIYSKKTDKKVKDLHNAIVYKADGYDYVLKLFSDRSIDKIYILFPDPWHKKRHTKRRPITTEWLGKIHKKLTLDGEIFFATDWDDYYNFVQERLKEVNESNPLFHVETGVYNPEKFDLIETHYYDKWLEMERTFNYITIKKK